jgi:hypothetical protein
MTISAHDKLGVHDLHTSLRPLLIKMPHLDLTARIRKKEHTEEARTTRTRTGRARGSRSASSSVESVMDAGTAGRSTCTPCARIESRKMDSMRPWCSVICGVHAQVSLYHQERAAVCSLQTGTARWAP